MASVDDWLDKYDEDLQSARENTQSGKIYKECHLAVESLLKAVLTKKGIEFRRTHDTTMLASNLPNFPDDKKKLLSFLYSTYDRRYPDDLGYAESKSPTRVLAEVEELREWADKHHL